MIHRGDYIRSVCRSQLYVIGLKQALEHIAAQLILRQSAYMPKIFVNDIPRSESAITNATKIICAGKSQAILCGTNTKSTKIRNIYPDAMAKTEASNERKIANTILPLCGASMDMQRASVDSSRWESKGFIIVLLVCV